MILAQPILQAPRIRTLITPIQTRLANNPKTMIKRCKRQPQPQNLMTIN